MTPSSPRPALRFPLLLAAGLAALVVSLPGCGGDEADDGSSASTATLSTPTINSQPASVTAVVGATVSFVVTASGSGLYYQWAKDGVALAGATAASLTLANVSTADAGSYRVNVSNTAGSVFSSAATLTVNTASATLGNNWTLNTGANPADLHKSLRFQRIHIDLAARAVSTTSARLSVGTTTDGVTPVRMDGSTVLKVAEDGPGLNITASLPAGTLAELALLSGSYGKTVTV